jgi:hypothetical protein
MLASRSGLSMNCSVSRLTTSPSLRIAFLPDRPRIDVGARIRIDDAEHVAAIADTDARVMRRNPGPVEHERVVRRRADARVALGDQHVVVFLVRKMQAHAPSRRRLSFGQM